MTINWNDFTPLLSLIGGMMIGLAALILMLSHGRVMGMSGILTRVISTMPHANIMWRIVFIVGTCAGALAYVLLHTPTSIPTLELTWHAYVAALLVGIGSAIGSGCTSGHGICGLARFSVRSFVAVLAFMLAALATVFVIRHLL